MSELKPCPFCGGRASLNQKITVSTLRKVTCSKCFARTKQCRTEAEAITAWNRRAQPANSRFADCHIWEPEDRLDTISDKCDVLIKAADIEALMQPANEPLTLEELRGMDGEPVWVVDAGSSENNGWYLVNLKYEPFFDKPDVTWDVLMSNDGQYFTMIQVGKGLTAYRRKPEEVHDAQ